MKAPDMTIEKNLHASVPPALLARAEAVAHQEQISLDELASEALQGHIARRTIERIRRDGEIRRGGMSDEQIENIVDDAIHAHRQELQGR